MYPDIGADAVAVEVGAFAAGDGEELGLGDAGGAHDGDGFAVADYGCAVQRAILSAPGRL